MVSHRYAVLVRCSDDRVSLIQLVRVQSRNGTKRITAQPTDTLRKFLDKVQTYMHARSINYQDFYSICSVIKL